MATRPAEHRSHPARAACANAWRALRACNWRVKKAIESTKYELLQRRHRDRPGAPPAWTGRAGHGNAGCWNKRQGSALFPKLAANWHV